MKRILTIILICLSSNILIAQGQVEVTGQVKDFQTKNALEFCTISVVSPKDSLINAAATDKNGFFKIFLNSGNYRFIFSFIGYKSDTTGVIAITEDKFLGVFKLKPNEKLLKEFSVVASSHENLIDRDTYIVTDKLRAGASDTREVLEKLNGVQYERYGDKIKVGNDANIIILVDGMKKDQEYIKNLSPDRLKKVEIIKNPGGRYGLEGYSAVINIILKKDYKGTDILLRDYLTVKPDADKTQPFLIQNGFPASINYVNNKLNVYAKYRIYKANVNFQSTDHKEYNNGLMIDEEHSGKNDMNTMKKMFYNQYTVGADYNINSKHTISFESGLMNEPMGKNINEQTYNVISSLNGNITDNVNTELKSKSGNMSSYGALFYEGKLDENNVINSDFRYSNSNSNSTNTYIENLLTNANEEWGVKGNNNSTKYNLYYTHTFKDKTSLDIGYGNTWKKSNTNNYKSDTLASQFQYSDIRHNISGYYTWQMSKKFGIKLGGAAEMSNPVANGQKNSYLIFEPFANIQYKPSGKLSFTLKYRSSSNYPSIDQTNPFTTVIDKQSVNTGNPKLQPAVTNKVSLQTDILNGLITIEPYYLFSNNYITNRGTLLSNNIFEYTYSNSGEYRHCGVDTWFNVPISKSIVFKSDFDFFNSSIKYSGENNDINDWTMSSQLFYQNQKSYTVVIFKYDRIMFKDITMQGYNKSESNSWSILIQQQFFNKRLNVMLMYFLPLNLGVDYNTGSYIKTGTYSESKLVNQSMFKNVIYMQVTYRFNKGKAVKNTEKNIEIEQEKKRKGLFG